jgi:CRISPR-associated endonuclease/helicase Cas3
MADEQTGNLDRRISLLWAKSEPWRSLVNHCLDVGETAVAILTSPAFKRQLTLLDRAWGGLGPESTSAWIGFLVSAHDLGKCDPEFQSKSKEAAKPLIRNGIKLPINPTPGFRHEARSAEWIRDYLRRDGWGRKPAVVIGQVLRGHHGDFGAETHASLPENTPPWPTLREGLVRVLRDHFKPPHWQPKAFPHAANAGLLLVGLTVMADWIASNAELFGGGDDFNRERESSSDLADRAVSRLGIDQASPVRRGTFSEIWPDFIEPRPIQVAVESVAEMTERPELCIIEAPMGEGKTEAAIYLATQWQAKTGGKGFYIGLPTGATSNQMHTRVSAFCDRLADGVPSPVRLVHGMAWLLDEYSPDTPPRTETGLAFMDAMEWFRPARRALLAPLGVGTVDQAMMAVLHVKFGFLRLFGLASGVLIIDEVHAYDTYMGRILNLLLTWCSSLEVPVILLSATLPSIRRKELLAAYTGGVVDDATACTAYPLISVTDSTEAVRFLEDVDTNGDSVIGVVRKDGLLGDPEASARLAVELAASGGCVCVLVNTVAMAQQTFDAVRRCADPETELLLFHSRFTVERRAEIERCVLDGYDKRSLLPVADPHRTVRPERSILVATQVVEQSLDIDFDVMITEIAPIDLLLQRSGRLHRHVRPGRPCGESATLYVLTPDEARRPDFGGTERVYSRFVLLKTLAMLRNSDRLNLPEDLRRLVEAVYDDNSTVEDGSGLDQKDVSCAFDEMKRQMADASSQAERFLIPSPDPASFDLALMHAGSSPYEEDDTGRRAFLHAQTRQGDRTHRVLLLRDDEFIDEFASDRCPHRSVLRQIFQRQVSLPVFWLAGLVPADGFDTLDAGPRWLRGLTCLRLRQGEWCGYQSGKSCRVVENMERGVLRFVEEILR